MSPGVFSCSLKEELYAPFWFSIFTNPLFVWTFSFMVQIYMCCVMQKQVLTPLLLSLLMWYNSVANSWISARSPAGDLPRKTNFYLRWQLPKITKPSFGMTQAIKYIVDTIPNEGLAGLVTAKICLNMTVTKISIHVLVCHCLDVLPLRHITCGINLWIWARLSCQ